MANRETQVVIEVPRTGDPNVRATQVAIEVSTVGFPKVRMTQCVIEVVTPKIPGPTVKVVQEFAMP